MFDRCGSFLSKKAVIWILLDTWYYYYAAHSCHTADPAAFRYDMVKQYREKPGDTIHGFL